MSGETAPANPFLKTGKSTKPLVVRIKDGSNPAVTDEKTDYRVVEIRKGIGTRGLPYCELVKDLGATEARVVDVNTPTNWNMFVEVLRPDADGNLIDELELDVSELMFWGELSIQQMVIDGKSKTEGMKFTARVEPKHFGEVLLGSLVLDSSNVERQQHTDVVFNVVYDGKVFYNRSMFTNKKISDDQDGGDTRKPFYYMLDPYSAQNGYAIGANGGSSVEPWTLAEAIKYLCYTLNTERWIDNPDPEHIDTIFDVAADLRGFRMHRGVYLPQALDQICGAYGFSWYLDKTTKEDSTNKLQIRFFRFGAGDPKQIYLQKPGEELDLSKTSCLQADMTYNVQDIANRTIIHGSYPEYEVTKELHFGWPEMDDGYSADDLDSSRPDSTFITDPTKRDAWRRFVANEGGDYTGMRVNVRPAGDPWDLTSLFGNATVQKRRRFHDPLARDRDGLRIEPLVEWYNPNPSDGTAVAKWEKVKWQYHPLHHECGIYFSGDRPPQELIDQGSSARVRITACIRGDERVSGEAKRRADSPNGSDVTLFLNNHDWFADRRVIRDGTYASVLKDNPLGHDEKDDRNFIKDFATKVRDQEDAIRLSASFVLHDIHTEYKPGDLLDKIDGRNVSLNRMSTARSDKRYLQVTEISFDTQGLTTSLRLESLELLKRDLDTGTI